MFPFALRISHANRTRPVCAILVSELERRVAELHRVTNFKPVESTNEHVQVNACTNTTGITQCGWPVLRTDTILPGSPEHVAACFASIDKQRSPAINHRIKQLAQVDVLVVDGKAVPACAMSIDASVDLTPYKYVACVYMELASPMPLFMSPIDSVDLMAFRQEPDNGWRLSAMSCHHPARPPSASHQRLEVYAVTTTFASASPDGSSTRVTSLSCMRLANVQPDMFLHFCVADEVKRLAAIRKALS
jgi:hypothetical protein